VEAAAAPPESPAAEDLIIAVEGMTCASCVRRVERSLARVAGTEDAAVNLATGRAAVRSAAPVSALLSAVERAGYHARLVDGDGDDAESRERREAERAARRRLIDIAIGVTLTVPLMILSTGFMDRFAGEGLVLLALAAPVWLYVGREFHRSALLAAFHGTVTMDTLISLGSSVAFL
jgi:cation transport ATPase